MTVIHLDTGYLADPYLEQQYVTNHVVGSVGFQSLLKINGTLPAAMQVEILIQGAESASGQQAEFTIGGSKTIGQQAEFTIGGSKTIGQQAEFTIGGESSYGMQSEFTILGSKTIGQQAESFIQGLRPYGMQSEFTILGSKESGQQATLVLLNPGVYGSQSNLVIEELNFYGQQAEFTIIGQETLGQQTEINIVDHPSTFGLEAIFGNVGHSFCRGYLEGGYLSEAYMGQGMCASSAQQANLVHIGPSIYGQQAEFTILSQKDLAQQAEFTILSQKDLAQQAEILIGGESDNGMQAEFTIEALRTYGQQAEFTILETLPTGMQADFISQFAIGMQSTISLYNTNNLRILCTFPSRGSSTATGLNAWGNLAGRGLNWAANTTAGGDFNVSNLNTDIVEEVWRSAPGVVTGINLDCDTERPQGVFTDTLAILNHNMTSSATVTLLGSNSPTFSTIGVTIPLQPRVDDPNIYYIAPTLPNSGYRYWRLSVDDASNPDTHVQIGTIIFGPSSLFVGECFVDQVGFQLADYTDSVETEAFTNVTNSRAQKKILNLEFRSLSYLRSNFRLMRSLFRTRRTVNKCLWIPTPDPVSQELTSRFALFAKLVQIPNEQHNHKGGEADYVSFSIQLDEAK